VLSASHAIACHLDPVPNAAVLPGLERLQRAAERFA